MEALKLDRSILVVIDIQGRLSELVWRGELLFAATKRLLDMAELFGVPVALTEQYPKGLGPTHPDILAKFDALTVPKRRFDKSAFGCCDEPGFEEVLRDLRPDLKPGQRQLVVAGIETHVCVMQTVLASLRVGDQVHVCWDAVSGRGEEHRRWALERMQQAGAVITNLESVGFEWARTKDHPKFKAWSAMLKEGQVGG